MSRTKRFLLAFVIAVAMTEFGNRTASIPLSRVSAPGWMVATLVWPAGVHEGTATAAVGSIIVAFVINVALWTLVLYAVLGFIAPWRGADREAEVRAKGPLP